MLLGFFPKEIKIDNSRCEKTLATRGDMINSGSMALVLSVANVIGADDYRCTSQKPTGAGDTWIVSRPERRDRERMNRKLCLVLNVKQVEQSRGSGESYILLGVWILREAKQRGCQ